MSDVQSAEILPPHFRCDCVPDLGPAHCHRCSRIAESPIRWDDALCKAWVESPAYAALLTAHADAALLVVSDAFDAAQAVLLEAPAAPEPVAIQAAQVEITAPATPVPAPPKVPLVFRPPVRHEDGMTSWRFTNLALKQAAAMEVTPQDIQRILDAPHVSSPSASGDATNHYGRGLLIMVDVDGECIISVIESATDAPDVRARAAAAGQPRVKAYSGGAGRSMPSTLKELSVLLKKHGFATEFGGSGHTHVTHELHPGLRITVPTSPSDRRSYSNALSEIKRQTGIDITKKG